MIYVLIQLEGFREEFLEQLARYKKMTSEELVASYNRQVEIGIVGVYRQAISIAALMVEFDKRFTQTPILLEANILLSLTDKVKIVDNELRYLDDTIVPTTVR